MSGSDSVEKPPEVKELQRIAVESGADYDKRFGPTFDRFIGDVLDNRVEAQRARDVSTAESASAFGRAIPQVATATARRGGNEALALGNLAADMGTSRGLGLVDVDQASGDRRLAEMGGLVDIGRGEKTEAFRGLSSVADIAARQAEIDALTSAANRSGMQDATITAGGLAANIYNKKRPDPLSLDYGGPIGPAARAGTRTSYAGGP